MSNLKNNENSACACACACACDREIKGEQVNSNTEVINQKHDLANLAEKLKLEIEELKKI